MNAHLARHAAPYTPSIDGVRFAAKPSRSGMTLVELLVTMVVISIISSLSLAGLAVARNSAKKAKTTATIRKISEIILPYYEEYETRRPSLRFFYTSTGVETGSSSLTSLPNGRSYLTAAKQIAIRRLMALELPERRTDFTSAMTKTDGKLVSDGTTDYVDYPPSAPTIRVRFTDIPPAARRYYNLTQPVRDAGTDPVSSELLHLIVTRGPVADPDIVSHFRDDEVRDTNGNQLLEFVDGWNRPIAFRRWPTGFASPIQPVDGTNRNIDALISDRGHRLVPLIFSAGPDGAYDVVSDVPDRSGNPLSYTKVSFDPFALSPTAPAQPPLGLQPQSPPLNGSVVLVPRQASATSPMTFEASRMRSGSSLPANAFQTIGSERDVGSADNESTPNGVVESIDNIHNHDMTR